MKWKRLYGESLGTYRCHRCGKPTREDRFNLPALCDSQFIANNSKDIWDKFIHDNMAEFKKLGLEEGRYDTFEPVCELCSHEIEKSEKYKKLWQKWKDTMKDSLGGNDKIEELKVCADNARNNIKTMINLIRGIYKSGELIGDPEKNGWFRIDVYRTRFGQRETAGEISIIPTMLNFNDSEESMKYMSEYLHGDKILKPTILIKAYGSGWAAEMKKREFQLDVDVLTATTKEIEQAFEKVKDDIWRFL